jgi:hypothetical protein
MKPVKKGRIVKGSAPPRLPDEEEHRKHLHRVHSEKERREIERLRGVLAAGIKNPLR